MRLVVSFLTLDCVFPRVGDLGLLGSWVFGGVVVGGAGVGGWVGCLTGWVGLGIVAGGLIVCWGLVLMSGLVRERSGCWLGVPARGVCGGSGA